MRFVLLVPTFVAAVTCNAGRSELQAAAERLQAVQAEAAQHAAAREAAEKQAALLLELEQYRQADAAAHDAPASAVDAAAVELHAQLASARAAARAAEAAATVRSRVPMMWRCPHV